MEGRCPQRPEAVGGAQGWPVETHLPPAEKVGGWTEALSPPTTPPRWIQALFPLLMADTLPQRKLDESCGLGGLATSG